MRWMHGVRARVQLLVARRAAESRMDEEVRFHIEMETERLVRDEHLARGEAERRARVAFGGVTQHTEALREGRGLAWIGGLSLDAKLALRMLGKNPGLTFVAVIGMAVAVTIGAVSYSAIHALIGTDLPLDQGDRIVAIQNFDPRSGEARATHLHDLPVWRDALTTVSELGAYRTVDRNLITADGRAESVRIAELSASGFRIARVPPLLGRTFDDADERAGAPPVVVIGYTLWRSRFAARPDIVGQPLQLGDVRYTIVGVMPEDFAFPINNRVWTPLRLDPADYERGYAPGIDVFGRMAPGATIDDVQRQLAIVGQRLAAAYPATHATIHPRVLPYTRTFIDGGETAWMFQLIQLAVTMLLVVIGTNVAILVYARTASRMGEIAIRTALGASRARVVGQLFAEALALSLLASIIGVAAARAALGLINPAIVSMGGEQVPFWIRFHITPGVIVYCIGLAVLAAVIVGVVPALKATRAQVRANLQELSAGSTGMRLGKSWTFLIISQVTVAVAVLPLAIGGIAAWSHIEAARAELATKHVLTATLSLDRPELAGARLRTKRTVKGKTAGLGAPQPDSSRDEREYAARSLTLRGALVDRLRAEPGVVDVVFASNPPAAEVTERVETDAAPASTPLATSADSVFDTSVVGAMRVDYDFFNALDIPILAGRSFTRGDFSPTARPVIVNRSLAKKLFGTASPLGRRVRSATLEPRPGAPPEPIAPWEEIVGVIPDFPVDSSTPAPKVYRPLSPADAGPVTIAVRLQGPPLAFTNRLRELAIATSPMLRVESIKPLDVTLAEMSAGNRLVILALELMTLSALLLSVAGIYALMSFTVTRRRREIGIRAALGAGAPRLLINVLSRVAGQVMIGVAIGIAIAAEFDHLLQGGWTGRRAAVVLPGVALLMLVVSLLAALEPAGRALRIQPTEALRAE